MTIVDKDEAFRRRLFEKSGLAMTANGTDDNLINPEGPEGEYSFMLAGDSETPLD